MSVVSTADREKPRPHPHRYRTLPLHPLAVTIREACAISSLGRTKMHELILAGAVETVKVGSRRLVLYASLQRLLSPGGS